MRPYFLLLFVFFLTAFKHPHYLSVTDLKYNSKEKSVQGYVKIFTHDFEKELKKIHGKPIDLINPTDTALTRKTLNEYLRQNFRITVNGTALKYMVIGFEHEQESIFMYIESIECQVPSSVTFSNTILFGSFKGQHNIVHMEVNGKRQSRKLTNPDSEAKFNF